MSIPSNPPIKKESWSCSICLEIMDGTEEHNGKACISKRCMHIFHESCVERSIDAKRSCPLCRTHLDRVSLMHNTDFEQECIEWQKDPYGYTLEAAFFRKYSCYPQDLGVRAEDVLRPRELHGQNWNPELTDKEKLKFIRECTHHGYPDKEFYETIISFYMSKNKKLRNTIEKAQRGIEETRQAREETRQVREETRLLGVSLAQYSSIFYPINTLPGFRIIWKNDSHESVYFADKQALRLAFVTVMAVLYKLDFFDKENKSKEICLSIIVNELGLICTKAAFKNNLPLANIENECTQNQKVALKILKIASSTIIGPGISYVSRYLMPRIPMPMNSLKKIVFMQSGFKLYHFLASGQSFRDRD